MTESPSPESAILTRPLAKLDLWLTPKVMKDYRPSDFENLDVELQKDLKAAVREFRSFARTVAPNASASNEQYIEGLKRFEHVARLVRRIILDEWAYSVESLVTDVEGWSRARNWPFRRETRELSESLLGQYTLPRLLIYAKVAHVLLEPVARFVPGAFGVAEISVIPSYSSIRIPRTIDGWRVLLPFGGEPEAAPLLSWSESVFEEAVNWLIKHA